MNSPTINLQYTTINESLPDFIYEGLKPYVQLSNTYHPQPIELREKLAQKHKVPVEMIFLTAGIDEAIQMFAKTYGEHAYTFSPTYIEYKNVNDLGGSLTEVPSLIDGAFQISTELIPNASLIFLANPNNPVGITSKEKVLELVQNNRSAQVVIDEAYGEFAEVSVISEVSNHQNLTLFRSFSKAYAMAGCRVGYFVSHPQTIEKVRSKTQWSNVSYLSIGAALIAMDHEEYYVSMRKTIRERRDVYRKRIADLGFTILPSHINAILLQFPTVEEGTQFVQYLGEHQIVVSHGNGGSNIGLDHSFVRIAIGSESEMDFLFNSMRQYPQTT